MLQRLEIMLVQILLKYPYTFRRIPIAVPRGKADGLLELEMYQFMQWIGSLKPNVDKEIKTKEISLCAGPTNK